MQVDGTCHCGEVKYEAEVNPAHVVVCHCTDFQALSGIAFRVVEATTPGSFRLTHTEPKTYVMFGERGAPREQSFCGKCGSPIWSAPPGGDKKILSGSAR